MDVREIHTVVVGSGAAGLNAADRLFPVWSPGSGARDREHELGNLA